MPYQETEDLTYFSPQRRLFVTFEQRHVIVDEVTFEEVVCYFRVLYYFFKVSKNIDFILSFHSVENFFKLIIHLIVYDSLSQGLRFDVRKTQLIFIEVYRLYNFNILIANDRLYSSV